MNHRHAVLILIMLAFTFSSSDAIDIKDVTFKIPGFGKVIFNHNQHFKQKSIKNNCKVCHNAVFNLRARLHYTMAEMGKGKSCGACHNGKNAFIVTDCLRCHPVKDINFKVKDAGDVKFSHALHTGIYKCEDCHAKRYKPSPKHKSISMAQMEASQSCGGCHDDKTAFTVKGNCERCHKM